MKPFLSARQYLWLDLMMLLAMLGAATWHSFNGQWIWVAYDAAVVFGIAAHIRHWLKVLSQPGAAPIASR